MKKCAPKRKKYLIPKSSIQEDLFLIEGSDTDYITKSGKVYKDYGDGMMFPKQQHINNHNGYIYVSVTYSGDINKSRRLHVLLAKTFLFNPNPLKLKIVGHKNNIKTDCRLENLYWTDNRENSQRAVDDKLSVNKRAENDESSTPVKVLDRNHNIVGVYGSIRECCRCIKNLDVSFVASVYEKENYKPRSKKYIYQKISLEEFNMYPELQNIKLEENDKVNKKPKVFRLKNIKLGFDEVMDNQKEAAKITGFSQAQISNFLKHGSYTANGWYFEKLGEKEYREGSGFQKLLSSIDIIVVRNINTKEIKKFDTAKEAQEFFGLSGNDFNGYIRRGNIIMSEWEFLYKESKQNQEVEEIAI